MIQTLTTGSGGTATFSNLTPGTYTIREKTAPQGYLNSSPNTQTVTVTAGNTASVMFTNNRKTSKIRIQKTDQLTGQALAGAEFTITRLSAPAGSSGVGSVAAIITTDENGMAETGWLEWGRFRITETKVPEDYQDSGYSVEIEAYENGKTYVIDVQNQPIPGYIQLTKTDANRGTPLSGVQFDIYYNDAYGSGPASTMTTNADGVARSSALRKGTYQVKEHANPEGYTGELVTLDAIVKPDETTYLSADNQPIQGKIRIQKSDQLTGEALAGAEFTITRLSSSSAAGGAGVGETVILTTDENGVAETGWLDYGTYEVRETKVPVHFVDNSFSQQIALFEHEKTYITLGPGMPYKSGGNMQTLDMLYSAATNKQFITVQTKSGETYYLVIDYDKPIDEEAEIYETYFLNLVDNRDLLAVLADDEKPTPTPVPTPTPTPIPTVAPTAVPIDPNTGDVNAASMLSLMLLGLIGGGAAVWFAMSRKNGRKEKNLLDEYEFEDDLENEMNESS